jgi:hypothetical protein
MNKTAETTQAVPMNYRIALLLVGFIALVGAALCGPAAPSDRVVMQLVREQFQEGPSFVISKVEILERGAYNRQGKYWPVRARVVGQMYTLFGWKQQLDGDYHVYKDDYGKWAASYQDD